MTSKRILATAILAAAMAEVFNEHQDEPRIVDHVDPKPRPRSYGVHLSKAERKGKTWREIQAIRYGVAP
ncbi:MAG: hypothetical protein WC455_16150 [Dehalococcoidia bacterium]